MILNPCMICSMHPYTVAGHKNIKGISLEIHKCPSCGTYFYNPFNSEVIKKIEPALSKDALYQRRLIVFNIALEAKWKMSDVDGKNSDKVTFIKVVDGFLQKLVINLNSMDVKVENRRPFRNNKIFFHESISFERLKKCFTNPRYHGKIN